jgi:2-oxoisovalerate dehydrogenase E1 component
MLQMLERGCVEAGLEVDRLDLVVPHQANGRIIEAVRERLGGRATVLNDVANYGNTSSSSIPLALSNVLAERSGRKRVGLCAFGAGFTFGAAVLEG